MTDHGLLAAVIAAPDDDKPRLIFADWLDERGDPERAEFVRVQVELARTVSGHNYTDEEISQGAGGDPLCGCRWCALRQRERELFAANGCHQVEWMGKPAHDLAIAGRDWAYYLSWFTRGFVSHLTCSWADFSRHADAIRSACPLTDVRFTDWPPPDEISTWYQEPDGSLTLNGIRFELPTAEYGQSPLQHGWRSRRDHEDALRYALAIQRGNR